MRSTYTLTYRIGFLRRCFLLLIDVNLATIAFYTAIPSLLDSLLYRLTLLSDLLIDHSIKFLLLMDNMKVITLEFCSVMKFSTFGV